MEENEVRIYLGSEIANLYELGWISSDLSQVLEFAELIQGGNKERAEKYFGDKARGFNRYANIGDKNSKRPEIVDVKKGSVELVVTGLTLAATIIMPLVQIAVQNKLALDRQEITFQVSAKDVVLSRVLNAYENGEFGTGTDGLQMLMSILQQKNYDVSVLNENIYLIEHVVDKYSKRIVKTIKKNMRAGKG